jgi:O-antigen/teichoic acid export membrane protein
MAITSFIGVFYPVASKYYANNSPEEYKEICQTTIKCILIFVFLAIVFTLCLSKEIILLLFGAEYENSIEVFRILIFLLIPLCGTALFGLFLAVSNYQKYDLVAISIATIFSPVLNYHLVKHFSYYGSVYANLVTFFILQALQFYFVNKLIFKVEYINSIIKPSVILLITVFFIYVSHGMVWYVKLPLVVLAYVVLVAAFRLIGRKDINIFLDA